jgi:hypothetical protein
VVVPNLSLYVQGGLRLILAGLALSGLSQAHAETLRLPSSDLQIVLPDDGTSWQVQQAETSDFIMRTNPAQPAVEMELAYFPAEDCSMLERFDELPHDNDAPMFADNVPIGWSDGPVLIVDGGTQRLLCLSAPKGAYLAGLFLPKGQHDAKPFRTMLTAIYDAGFPAE